MKRSIVTLTAALLAAASMTAHAANERSGRVIPLATPTSFGYTQIIGDRLCLFDTECRKIAEYSAYSEVNNHDIYSVDDGAKIYFYSADGLFMTADSGTEYMSYGKSVTLKEKDGYNAYFPDGRIKSLPLAAARKEAEAQGYDKYRIKYYDGFECFMIAKYDSNSWISVDTVDEPDPENKKREELAAKLEKYGIYYLERKIDDDRYIISKSAYGSFEYGVCDMNGNIIIAPQFSVLTKMSNGKWLICSSHKWDSYKYAVEKEITKTPDFKYDKAQDLGNGITGVKYQGRMLYLDAELNEIADVTGKIKSFEMLVGSRTKVQSYNIGDSLADMNGNALIRACDFQRRYIDISGSLCYARSYKGSLPTAVIYVPQDVQPIGEYTIAPDNGEIKQAYYTTDIKVTIDGEPIQGYACDGHTLICLNDLAEHGFETQYNNDSRCFLAEKSSSAESGAAAVTEYETIGEIAGYTVKSDIAAYVNGRYIGTEAIDGRLLVEAEALCAPPSADDPDYWMLSYLGISPYLMRCEYDDGTRTLSIETYKGHL